MALNCRHRGKAAEDCRTPRPFGASRGQMIAERLGVRQSSAAFVEQPSRNYNVKIRSIRASGWRPCTRTRWLIAAACLILPLSSAADTNPPPSEIQSLTARVKTLEESVSFVQEKLEKRINDLIWVRNLEDIATVDKVRFTGPPVLGKPATAQFTNDLIVYAYTFLPRKAAKEKLPLLVFVHGEVHGDLKPDEDAHIIRELIQQGYAIIAPEYRGSTGYGRDYWEQVDYGGTENDDVFAARNWMLQNHSDIDPQRVGIIGWSHGGMITLMNIFMHPKDYQVAYAGVPVADLVSRLGYKPADYRHLFSAPFHLGKAPDEDIDMYRRRSPVTHVDKLQTPLLIHGVTNDEDVYLLEIEHLIQALKAAEKKFEYKIYTNAPGGHQFNRLDTTLAKDSRVEVYRFLARHLTPPNPPQMTNVQMPMPKE